MARIYEHLWLLGGFNYVLTILENIYYMLPETSHTYG